MLRIDIEDDIVCWSLIEKGIQGSISQVDFGSLGKGIRAHVEEKRA